MNSVQPNSFVGLNSDNINEPSVNVALYKYLHNKKQAPPPTGTVGKCDTMRKRILQMSLFPDIYDKRAHLRNPGNVDFGEPHKIKHNQ